MHDKVAPAYLPRRAVCPEMLQIRGLALHLHRWPSGNGPVCLLLHGWMDTGATFQFLVDALPANWELIAPDWRGFGRSAWASGNYYFQEYLADLDALVTMLSPDQPVRLVGHSMGGNVGCLYAGIRPNRVDRLISLEGFGLPPTTPDSAPIHYRSWLREQTAPMQQRVYATWPAFVTRLQRSNPRLPADHAAFIAQAWAEDSPQGPRLRADPRHRTRSPIPYRLDEARACWRHIQAPTLWIMGTESPFARLDPALMAENRRCFASLRETRLTGCGHMMHHERPQAVAKAITDFMDALDHDGAPRFGNRRDEFGG